MNIEISDLKELDKDGWADLYRQYADFYKMPMDQSTLDIVWEWIQDEDEEFFGIVARDENSTPIGFMHFRGMLSPLRACKVGFLDDLFVAPAHRGTGVVEALFSALKQRAKDLNWPFVRWITAHDNERAQAVYNKLSERTNWLTYQLKTG